ncbi:putative membrane protein [uncultured delta proteobacterium]|uniref:Putative membrane protein n=1 Tax=uncultured delta proteobacterium TaxID=34034 RepID=A0A212JX40_9DELT|nr:putative membrane protein [uncultured delta proteobacterium]
MFFSPQRLPVSWSSVCIALLGAAYCAIQVAPVPVSVPCPGSGCQLFQDFTVHGVSLWWVGVAYFAFMVLVCLRRAYGAALAFATAALVADAVLLIVMLMTAACIACLGAGAIIAFLFFIIRRHANIKCAQEPGPSFVLIAWSGFFIAALAFAATEDIEPWRIAGPDNAERRVYFAPSCPACRDAITVFSGNAAFIPVAEKDSDNAAVYAMHKAIANGSTVVEALDAVMQAKMNDTLAEPPFPDSVIIRLKLIKNKAEVMRLGFTKLPLIMINGMPRDMRPANGTGNGRGAAASYGNGASRSSALPPELVAPLDSCGDANQEPCDPPR